MTVHTPIRLLLAAPLGVLAAVLVSCGSSGTGLIPAGNAGPLLADFQAVERAAKAGDGSCSATETAIRRTESDLQHLPASVDAGLHGTLQEGVSKLRELALETCAQPTSATTATAESPPAKTAPPSTTATTGTPTTSTSPAETTSTTATTPGATQPSSTEGGTAPGAGGSEGQAGESGSGSGEGAKNSGGASGGTGSGGTGSGGAEQ